MANLLQDDEGNESSMRILFVFIMTVATIVWAYISLKNGHIEPLNEGHGLVVLAMFGGKATQKFAERNKKKSGDISKAYQHEP